MGSRSLVRIIPNSDKDYSIAIRGNSVVLAIRDPHDPFQNWFKDEIYGKTKRDAEGQPAFALINEATEEAIVLDSKSNLLFAKHCDYSEEPTLWTSKSMRIRWMHNTSLVFNASGKHDGAIVHLWSLDSERAQSWRIIPQEISVPNKPTPRYLSMPTVTISCRAKEGYNLTICNDAVMLAPSNLRDQKQHWIKETTYGRHAKDKDGKRGFALVNKATGQAIKQGFGQTHFVRLVPFDQTQLDASILWTQGVEHDDGFCHIRMINYTNMVFDVINGKIEGWVLLGLHGSGGPGGSVNQSFKIQEQE